MEAVSYRGSGFYDDPELFNAYMERRLRSQNANDMLEKPILDELLGDVRGLRILDLGCGEASFGRDLLARGCKAYVGLDGSRNMVEKARETLAGVAGVDGATAEIVHSTMEAWECEAASFDLVVTRMALHYLEDLRATFEQVYRCLAPGGRFVFSVQHPVVTSCNASLEQSARRGAWLVDDYFVSGARDVQWLGGSVVHYHRTVEEYFGLLQETGFRVTGLRESKPRAEKFAEPAELARRAKVPLFLLLAGEKML